MANLPSSLPSGMGIVGPGAVPGDPKLPAYVKLPAHFRLPNGAVGVLPGLPGTGAGGTPGPIPPLPRKTGPVAPFEAAALPQTFGIGSGLNPMALFDLMNLNMESFVPPFGAGGMTGYPTFAVGGAGLSAPAGPAVSGALASAPLPRSGGKGAMMG